MDEHFRTSPFGENIPVMLGLTGVWNTTFLGYPSLAILPYTQALSKLAPHIQQVCPLPRNQSSGLSPGCALAGSFEHSGSARSLLRSSPPGSSEMSMLSAKRRLPCHECLSHTPALDGL